MAVLMEAGYCVTCALLMRFVSLLASPDPERVVDVTAYERAAKSATAIKIRNKTFPLSAGLLRIEESFLVFTIISPSLLQC
jgi:hypothetical protein